MSKTNLKFGIIGFGRIGQRHAAIMHEMGQLSVICDTSPTALIKAKENFGWTTNYASLEELLAAQPELDVVAVCTPNYLHAQQSIALLNAGYHVVCEKPMALTAADCKAMTLTSEQSGNHLFIVKQNRFNPPVVALKQLIESGKLGNLYSVQLNCFWNRNESYYNQSNWKGKKTLDGGTLFTQFSHFIDLMLWICGDYKRLNGFKTNAAHKNQIEFEDSGSIAIEFESGILGTVHYTVNSFEKNMEGSITIFAEKGTVKIGGQYLNEIEYSTPNFNEFSNLPQGNGPNNYGSYQGSMSNHNKVYENVLDVVLHGGEIAVNSHEGILSVQFIEEFYKL